MDGQKQILGEKLYPMIAAKQPALCGKITGMLLERSNSDVFHLLENTEALEEQMSEAISVLEKHAKSNSIAESKE